MKTLSLTLVAAFAGLCLASCAESTGNPREGGLFGWNRAKAEGRLQDRRNYGAQINDDTQRVDSENRRLRNTRDQLR